ncbi:MAG TPA: hypothetical protein VK171_06140, partial [Fimbriimonas sp.]|nr:hypothetical protein [Fimbriimonas sp.]
MNDSLKCMRAINTLKTIAIAAGIITSVACGGLFMSEDSLITREVYTLNVANGAGPINTRIS